MPVDFGGVALYDLTEVQELKNVVPNVLMLRVLKIDASDFLIGIIAVDDQCDFTTADVYGLVRDHDSEYPSTYSHKAIKSAMTDLADYLKVPIVM
ncbi:hypothetical protein FHW67_000906 [Herbaspirillum sp. Sphag1AN]|uniref:hypothetical protein n=1 Tax=unclassified Herbaspirillum TaxID=2624150 RepID=UPI001607806B|nr:MULTISPECIES: hypothetical protein [unclassified Herbaspirillum]MBB3211658.1 hypothetical protein [Herbaspirillum sp. Sphag1AN]MBB3245074.1 hypothetical protein [Herbaspirillum sp. Sphag64]